MNIRLRLTLWYTAIFSLILIIFSLVVGVGLTRSLLNSIDTHLQREVSEILGNLKFGDDDDHTGGSFQLGYTPEEGVYWRLLNDQGRPLIDPGQFAGATFNTALVNLKYAQLENATMGDGAAVRLYTAPFIIERQGAGVVQVAESTSHVQDVQRQLVALLAIGIPLTLLASGAGGWFLASSALAPIDRITRAARQISAHDLHQRLNLNLPNDEVGRLAATFDQMLARLDNAFNQQRRFIADASHEMKTPLTILKGDVEVALARPRSAEAYRQTLENVNETTDRLIALVQELLLLARADSRQAALKIASFNLAQLLTDQVSSLMGRAVQKQIALNLDAPDVLPIEADESKLSRLFMNLVDNALKYCPPGASVTVRAEARAEQICVTVTDTGPGIAPEHLPYLFDRFFRVDQARARILADGQTSGAGLGLSIVQWLAEVHHGRVEVASVVNQGATFTVWLPQKQNPPKTED